MGEIETGIGKGTGTGKGTEKGTGTRTWTGTGTEKGTENGKGAGIETGIGIGGGRGSGIGATTATAAAVVHPRATAGTSGITHGATAPPLSGVIVTVVAAARRATEDVIAEVTIVRGAVNEAGMLSRSPPRSPLLTKVLWRQRSLGRVSPWPL